MMVPTTPNRPLSAQDEPETFGKISLRYNGNLEFLENDGFDPTIVFYDDNYQNNQSLSLVFKTHMEAALDLLKRRYRKRSKIVEVGCGKGDFIELASSDGWFEIEGYDGAYEGTHPHIHKRYLNESDTIGADIIVLRHVLEHIQRPHQFLALLASIFGATDIYIEVPDYCWIIKEGSYFDITYEHVNYFSPKCLSSFFRDQIQYGHLFGGQYQFSIANLGQLEGGHFADEYEGDSWEGRTFTDLFPSFVGKVEELQTQLLDPDGNAFVWGAATKGVMFLHHLKRTYADFFSKFRAAIDINDKKIGKFLPSSKLPIISPENYFDCAKPGDLIVISNPNYKDEIAESLASAGLTNLTVVCL